MSPKPLHRRTKLRAVILTATMLPLLMVFWTTSSQKSADAGNTCTLYASPEGSDTASGSREDPFRSVQHLVDTLAPQQTGCLLKGTYTQEPNALIRIKTPDITLRSAPGTRAEIEARVYLPRGSDGVTLRDLNIDGSPNPLPSVTVTAKGARLINNDITNHNSTICLSIGNPKWGKAANTLIKHNRIHHCGKLPPTNHHHGIYIGHATHTKVIANLIYKNADRAIQLYPNAQNSTIQGNVIDANGEGILFSGLRGHSSSGNLVKNNIISNSTVRWNVAANWRRADAPGTNNRLSKNCLWASHSKPYYRKDGGVTSGRPGLKVRGNRIANPLYVDAEAGDYRLREESPCRGILGRWTPPLKGN
ncbi:hypothetical protein RxyAA322_11850 [Rubrobacter xylanophilus]|uniref:Right handed beta helix domain-containing protein n=1 Tax=Rubrobacter xylanophilus TaxID=49319 RepID=A0A510HHA4_9ACTN|nr:right-handed parallel beta-helix repeat-containing protein [Rubrobacter xylanophilus]BBL79331.1 hypothetical protein RxyAA322_11850 [Rubrobacter xylanophilus]